MTDIDCNLDQKIVVADYTFFAVTTSDYTNDLLQIYAAVNQNFPTNRN